MARNPNDVISKIRPSHGHNVVFSGHVKTKDSKINVLFVTLHACSVSIVLAFFLKMAAVLRGAPMVLTLFPLMSLFLTPSSASPELEKFFDGLAALNASTVASILDSINNQSCECVKSLVALTKDRKKMLLCKYWPCFIYLLFYFIYIIYLFYLSSIYLPIYIYIYRQGKEGIWIIANRQLQKVTRRSPETTREKDNYLAITKK